MYIYYDPETLLPGHVVLSHDESYDPACNGEHHVVLPPGVSLPLERVHLARGDDDAIIVAIRRDLPIVFPDRQHPFGAVVRFGKVPRGTAIAINGQPAGTMDSAGELEVVPSTTGFYAFVFALHGWMDARFNLEIVPRELAPTPSFPGSGP